MCTLTFVPLKSGNVITANRDESPLRNAAGLSPYISAAEREFLIAEEPLRGGTNIALGKENRYTVLLNGAFEPHDMSKKYGMSRGIVLLKSLDFNNAFLFADQFSFDNIQPFTLVDFSDAIREIRWDGNKIYKADYSLGEPRIWASAQLYSKDAIKSREQWFEELLENKALQPKDILDFHTNAGNGDEANDLVMNRENLVRTVSITQVCEMVDKKKVLHRDLIARTENSYGFEK